MSRPHTYVGEYPAQNERFGIYGVSEGEKCAVNLSKMGEYEVCILKPRILVQGILRRHRGEEHKGDQRVHNRTIKTG